MEKTVAIIVSVCAILGALGGLGVGGLFPQVQREKVALELKLTPHVNEHDLIRLEVDEKISEVAPGASNLGPSTSERSAKTIVVAKDRDREPSSSLVVLPVILQSSLKSIAIRFCRVAF